jgi:hypothetical protein
MRDGTPSGGDDLIGGRVGSFSIPPVDHDTRAVLSQQTRDGRTYAPRPADHDRAAAGEQRGHSSLPKVIISRFQ